MAIKERPGQLVIRLLPYGAEHITIHMTADGELLKNYSLPYVAEPNWVDVSTPIAKQQYTDWKKRLKYAFAEQPIRRMENDQGYHLLGRLVDLNGYSPKQKYTKQCDISLMSKTRNLC